MPQLHQHLHTFNQNFVATFNELLRIKHSLDSQLVLGVRSTTKDYIRTEHKLHSISKLLISQVTIPQVMFFEPIYISHELNMGTCIQQGDLFYSAGLHKNQCQPQLTQEKIRRGFGKNTGEQTERVEISKEEFPGSQCSMYGYILSYSRL